LGASRDIAVEDKAEDKDNENRWSVAAIGEHDSAANLVNGSLGQLVDIDREKVTEVHQRWKSEGTETHKSSSGWKPGEWENTEEGKANQWVRHGAKTEHDTNSAAAYTALEVDLSKATVDCPSADSCTGAVHSSLWGASGGFISSPGGSEFTELPDVRTPNSEFSTTKTGTWRGGGTNGSPELISDGRALAPPATRGGNYGGALALPATAPSGVAAIKLLEGDAVIQHQQHTAHTELSPVREMDHVRRAILDIDSRKSGGQSQPMPSGALASAGAAVAMAAVGDANTQSKAYGGASGGIITERYPERQRTPLCPPSRSGSGRRTRRQSSPAIEPGTP
jgi:hypothetical protein